MIADGAGLGGQQWALQAPRDRRNWAASVGAETRGADGQEVSVGSPPLAIEPTPDPIRTVLKGAEVRADSGRHRLPPGPISDYSSHSCWFKTLICSFCSAMLRPMSSVMFTALYDVMRAALYMQHLV